MKKNGYDKFFKAAREASRPDAPPARKAAPRVEKAEVELRKALKVKKNRRPFPILPLVSGALMIGAGLFYLAKPDPVDRWLRNVEIHFVGQASAEEAPSPEKPASTNGDGSAKAAASNASPATGDCASKDRSVAEDLSYIDKLRVRKEQLDLREKELNQLEEELQRQKVEVDQRIQKLAQMRRDIASVLKDRVSQDDAQIGKLVDLYSNMKPKQAADVIGSLQEDLAVQVLGQMKKKNAAEVMNLLPADKARSLSEKLTGYKR